ncbi:unnamed protein product, partial [Anisakis simplex]|uniref:Glucuronosyltransferase n=1 Tax=Anisakis simplex TaxID=6269 RepID=A0A0M3KDK4_ANISI
MQSFPAILWLFCTLQNVDSSRILFVVMHSSRSHIGSMLPMAMTLSEAGHDVHFMQTTQFDEPFKFPGSIKNHFIKVNISHVVHLQEAWQYLYNPT